MLPIIASLLQAGLPILAGAIASKGKEVVEEKLGVKVDDFIGTDEGRAKLKQLEYEHEETLLEYSDKKDARALEYFKEENKDRQDARERETRLNESEHADWLPKNISAILALIVVVAGFALLFITKDADVRTATVGLMTLVLGYYFGSSRASQAKDATIAALTKERQ